MNVSDGGAILSLLFVTETRLSTGVPAKTSETLESSHRFPLDFWDIKGARLINMIFMPF